MGIIFVHPVLNAINIGSGKEGEEIL